MLAARGGLVRVVIGKELLTSKITVTISRPFQSIANESGMKNAAKWQVALAKTVFFDAQNGDVFKDKKAKILTPFHTSGNDMHKHLTVEVVDALDNPTFWYQISLYDYWDKLHVHEVDALMKENDYLPITKDMMEVGRVYRKGEGKEDTYWLNAKAKKLVVWKNNEAVIPKGLLVDFADWVKIDHATFNA